MAGMAQDGAWEEVEEYRREGFMIQRYGTVLSIGCIAWALRISSSEAALICELGGVITSVVSSGGAVASICSCGPGGAQSSGTTSRRDEHCASMMECSWAVMTADTEGSK